MPQFNIHWKGCPHRHLPRIRVASPHYGTVCSRHFAHIAALEAGQLPYSLALQRARVQQRIRIRRGKHRARGSLGGIIALRQTSQRAMPNIQTLGLESPQEDIASKEQGNKDLEVPLFTDRLWTSPLRLSDDLVHSAESCCSSPSLITDRRDDLASSIDAVELAQCIDFQLSEGRDRQRGALNRRVGGKHDHVVSNDKVRKTSIYGRTPVLGRSRTYDPSIPIRRARRRTKSTSSKPDHQCQSRSVSIMLKRAAMDKQPSSTNRSAQQATIGSISSASTGSNSQPAQLSGLPSRTPAQLVALKHFGRELERHLIAQEAVRKACLHPSSPSSSTLSANTVVEFIPYMTEFQAAGLAVTSTEQRRPAIRQPRQEVAPLLPKDAGDKEQTPANASEGISNGSPITSHDGSGGGLYTDTTSSRTTLIEFSSYSEPNSAVAYPTGNVISKKSLLPWLRKPQEPSSLNQSIPVNSFDVYNDMRSSSTSTCETCATTIIEFSPLPMESESKQTEPDSSTIGLRPLDIKGIDMDKNSIKRKSRESAQPIVPKRPVPVLAGPKNDGINSGMISGNNPLPSAPSPKANQRTQSALAHPGSSRKGKAKSRDEPVPRSSRRTFSVEPTATSSTPVGPFRASSKLLALQKSSQVENPEPASIPKDMTSTTQSKSVPSSPLPPAHSLPSLPTKDCPLTSQLTHQSPGTSIPDQYGFETASIFEQALSDVEQLVKEESALTNLPRTLLADQGNRDPAKRKSTSYMPPELSSHVSNVATASSLGFATTSDSRTATTTDYSDIRDKDVFKGLQIALAAACNKDLDLWITKMSGCRVRGFLADLRAFEGLGVNTLADQAVRTAEKRRQEHNQWMRGHKYGYAQDCEGGLVQEKSKDRKGKRRPVRADDRGRLGLLIAEMLGNRDSRAGETVRERALAMGWRNRSVSAGY